MSVKQTIDILCEICERFTVRNKMGWCDHCKTYHCSHCARRSTDSLLKDAHYNVWSFGANGDKE